MTDGFDRTLREEVATKSDITLLSGKIAMVKSDLLGALRADKIDLLEWVVMLIIGQTAVFTVLKVLGH